ncbi:insulin-induced protein-domain-containing protein [Sordaria brevicollis]|uniref:Insulin-induced protein-domain-containing protein n=1 Tax=Sordaria brevicollis TaxID=83679 RepID=A0AAE0U0K4_SORBR|nr:insulin-induced protein-domain-containing protein [Sordaria brevicollis]
MDQTSNSGTQDGPKIFRPIPRRPFNLASPPMISRKDESPSPAPGRDSNTSPQPRITAADLRFLLDPRSPFNTSASPAGSGAVTSGLDSSNISRATSFRNLTSSTLFGIFSDPSEPNTAVTTPGVGRSTSNLRNGFFFGEHLKEETEDEADDRANVLGTAGDARDDDGEEDEDEDESYQDTITLRPKQRQRRVSSVTSTIPVFRGESSPSWLSSDVNTTTNPVMPLLWSLLRTTLLFALGMGYGVLVTRLPNGDSVVTGTGSYGWRYLTFWGLAGVVLGRLLPWFDQVWEETFGKRKATSRQEKERRRAAAAAEAAAALLQQPTKSSSRRASVTISSAETDEGGGVVTSPPEADWPLVVRSIGAFVGIVFAIRRLPWTSTMQVSITLALANPFLWYLIDRSKPGFLLSAAVGVTGSAIMMGLGNPDMMPAPVAGAGAGAGYHDGHQILTNSGGQQLAAMGGVLNGTASSAGGLSRGAAAARMEGAAVIETGVWMLSVLFCSCVCFGNIGRRLALNKSAASRGRWGGVR